MGRNAATFVAFFVFLAVYLGAWCYFRAEVVVGKDRCRTYQHFDPARRTVRNEPTVGEFLWSGRYSGCVLLVATVASLFFGAACHFLLKLREMPRGKDSWQYKVLGQTTILAFAILCLVPFLQTRSGTPPLEIASGLFLGIVIGEYGLLRGTEWRKHARVIPAVFATILSFVLNGPISFAVVLVAGTGGLGARDVGEGLFFLSLGLSLGYVGWGIGLIFYFFFTFVTKDSVRERILAVAPWISVGAAAIVGCSIILSHAPRHSHAAGLAIGLFYIACLTVPPQTTFWILLACSKLFGGVKAAKQTSQ
jgi:hypothetical protein